MGLRFRKRIKILPGLTLNISKSGFSTTIGARGASVNIGKNGVYGNAGIPGTGLYMREKIAGGKSSKRTKTTRRAGYAGGSNYSYSSAQPATIFNTTGENVETDNFAFGCSLVLIALFFGFMLGLLLGNLKLSFPIALGVIILVLIFRVVTANNKETTGTAGAQGSGTENVALDVLLKYRDVIDEATYRQLMEYKRTGARTVNVPIGTFAELVRMKAEKKKEKEEQEAERQPTRKGIGQWSKFATPSEKREVENIIDEIYDNETIIRINETGFYRVVPTDELATIGEKYKIIYFRDSENRYIQ